jgi:hypothetical protein
MKGQVHGLLDFLFNTIGFRRRETQSPHLRRKNPGFNPRFTPSFYKTNVRMNSGLNPGFGVLRCGPRIGTTLYY